MFYILVPGLRCLVSRAWNSTHDDRGNPQGTLRTRSALRVSYHIVCSARLARLTASIATRRQSVRRTNFLGSVLLFCSLANMLVACAATTPAITPAPTTPALPARTALSTACSVHVSSTNGTDYDTCGEVSETPCHSIQKGIDRAGNYNTVCVHEGELPKQHCAYSQLTMYLQVAIVVGLVGQGSSHEASCCAALMQ